jgi:hypothetical protein
MASWRLKAGLRAGEIAPSFGLARNYPSIASSLIYIVRRLLSDFADDAAGVTRREYSLPNVPCYHAAGPDDGP